MRRTLILIITACFFVAFNAIALENFYQSGGTAFYEENGTLEMLQASALFTGIVLYFASFLLGDGRSRPAKEESWISRGAALLCLSFFVREVDLETLSLPAPLVMPWVGNGRTVTLCILWALFVYLMARSQLNTTTLLRASVEQRVLLSFACAALLLCTGAVFDRGLIGGESARFYEELLESNAYFALLWPLNLLLLGMRQRPAQVLT